MLGKHHCRKKGVSCQTQQHISIEVIYYCDESNGCHDNMICCPFSYVIEYLLKCNVVNIS